MVELPMDFDHFREGYSHWNAVRVFGMGWKKDHFYPADDLRPHELDRHGRCWCHPAEDDDLMVIHNSLDRREEYETGERLLA